MAWKWLFFGFEGRIGRKLFWMCALVFLMVHFLAKRTDAVYFSDEHGAGPVSALVGLALIWPSLAIAAKRWHDRDKSAWWVLINLIPLIGWLWTLIETGFLPGTPGENRFGSDPLAERDENWRD